MFPSQTTHGHTAASNAIVHGVPVRFDGGPIAKLWGTFPPRSAVGRVTGALWDLCMGAFIDKVGGNEWQWEKQGKLGFIYFKMLFKAFVSGSPGFIPTCSPFSVDIPDLHLFPTLHQGDVRGIKLDHWMERGRQ